LDSRPNGGSELARVEQLGGEGLMLRQPGSRYEGGVPRLTTYVRVRDDDEFPAPGADA
jgi:DNA ligase-1